MTNRSRLKRLFWLFGAGSIVASLGLRLSTAEHLTGEAGDAADLPECPHRWYDYLKTRSDSQVLLTLAVPGQFALSGPTTDIAEFHDCQRFVVSGRDGQPLYDSLYAIFARRDLDSAAQNVAEYSQPISRARELRPRPVQIATIGREGLNLRTAAPSPGRAGRAWALVEVYAEGPYAPLGIKPGLNCGFFYYVGPQLEARMVPVGSDDKRCLLEANPDTLGGTLLEVRQVKTPPHTEGDYPPVARWDWDSRHNVQYFGAKCLDAWCVVGPGGFVDASLPTVPSEVPIIPSGSPPGPARVIGIKGWFDEQQLAPPHGLNPRAPMSLRGTVYPDPNLGSYTFGDFNSRQWLSAAWIVVGRSPDQYTNKLNLASVAGGSNHASHVELCSGQWSRCRPWFFTPRPPCRDGDGNWWAKITPAVGGKAMYHCVVRRDHSAEVSAIPGTARWRWRAEDDGLWMRCEIGCCEVEERTGT